MVRAGRSLHCPLDRVAGHHRAHHVQRRGDVPEPDSIPRLFESRVFGGILDGEIVRHCTRAEATTQHAELVEWCRIGSTPNAGVTEADLL